MGRRGAPPPAMMISFSRSSAMAAPVNKKMNRKHTKVVMRIAFSFESGFAFLRCFCYLKISPNLKMRQAMKYHIITYGCQMNKSDSERIAGVLNDCGWQAVDKFNQADLVILNSCSVRQSAEDRVYGEVDELAKLKKKNPALMVAVTGCMPGRDKEGKFKKKMPAVDLYFPINDLPRLPE
ncbi:MAG: hypothetical protein AAB568_00160, partial [Patescibacteria group bacterium]